MRGRGRKCHPSSRGAGVSSRGGLRVGVYTDQVYVARDGHVSCGRAFMRFVVALGAEVDELVVFGRLSPDPGFAPYAVSGPSVRFVALPYYRRGTSVLRALRLAGRSRAVALREFPDLDVVWIFGPHPMAVLFALTALRRRVPLVLGVRQDYPRYIANRLPSRWWTWAVPVAWALDGVFRLIATRSPTVVLGDDLARRYRSGRVLVTGFSLVSEADIVSLEVALARPWDGELRLLSVGRLDAEKNPLLLLDVLEMLNEAEPRWRLVVAGDGPLRANLERAVRERHLGSAVDVLGEVPNGPDLWRLYRSCHVFLHVALTEGLPQVLFEAQAAGLPIVATAVGGVPSALGNGESGLLVPPRDAVAAAAAASRIRGDPALRSRLVEAGTANVRRETLEAQVQRVGRFIRDAVARP